MKFDVREQLGRLETEEKMALAHRDYARATEIANRRIRLLDFAQKRDTRSRWRNALESHDDEAFRLEVEAFRPPGVRSVVHA